MMPAMIELEVPPIHETNLTGFVGAGTRNIRGTDWRAECHIGQPVKLLRNGVPCEWASATNEARKFANNVVKSLGR